MPENTALLLLVIASAAAIAYRIWKRKKPVASVPSHGTFTTASDTTVVDGPIDDHGHIDYAEAMNARIGHGATPETNGAVLLWQAFGPRPDSTLIPVEYFRRLGIDAPYNGTCFRMSSSTVVEDAARRPWTVDELPKLVASLRTNEAALKLVVEAIRRPHFFLPFLNNPIDPKGGGMLSAGFLHLTASRKVAYAFGARAMLHVGHGRLKEAREDLDTCHRLAARVGSGPTLMDAIVGLAMSAGAHLGEHALLDRIGNDPGRLAEFRTAIESLPPLPDVPGKMDLGERFLQLNGVMMLDRHGMACMSWIAGSDVAAARANLTSQVLAEIDWDPVLRARNRHTDQLVVAMRAMPRTERQRRLNQITRENTAIRKRVSQPSALHHAEDGDGRGKGEFVANVLISLEMNGAVGMNWEEVAERTMVALERAVQMRSNLRIAVALHEFHNESGRFPASLAELAPKHLFEVPADLFSGKPLIYRVEGTGCRLHSVGPNLRDDDGVNNLEGADDIQIRLSRRP